ncbi:MAG: twin-arginine translocation signal domain-containing protein, partial [Lysobacter sp.]
MSITRRTFLLGSAAAAATGAVSASAIARAATQA